jgi:hypothetical protein
MLLDKNGYLSMKQCFRTPPPGCPPGKGQLSPGNLTQLVEVTVKTCQSLGVDTHYLYIAALGLLNNSTTIGKPTSTSAIPSDTSTSSNSTSASGNESRNTQHTTKIAAGVAAPFGSLALLLGVFVLIRRRRVKKKITDEDVDEKFEKGLEGQMDAVEMDATERPVEADGEEIREIEGRGLSELS